MLTVMHYTVGKDQFMRSPLPAAFSHRIPPLPLILALETRIRSHHVTGTFGEFCFQRPS